MIMDKKLIYFPEPNIKRDSIQFYGAGKFNEESIMWSKDEARLAFIYLFRFLKDDLIEDIKKETK